MSFTYNLPTKMASNVKVKIKLDVFKIKRETSKKLKIAPAGLRSKANALFDKEKQRLLSDFDQHPVTMELQMGPEGENISGTLGSKGNLFSFIGFNAGDNPTAIVRSFLSSITLDKKKPRIRQKGSRATFEYTIQGGDKETLFEITKDAAPWMGKSWIKGVESGISGLGSYIYWKRNMGFPPSRSGSGVQSRTKFRSGSYRPTKYISTLLEKFKKRLKKHGR